MHTCLTRIIVVMGLLLPMNSHGEVLRWSSSNDITTLDPHANPDAFSDGILHDIYERLATRDKDFSLVPSLATHWQQINPTTLRFFLRPNVRFHDGSLMTADDVVFSLLRAMRPTSDHKEFMAGVRSVVKVDAMSVDVTSEKPLAPMLAHVSDVAIMSKAWLARHGATEPQDYRADKESYASHHAVGTGPFRLKSFEPGAKLELQAFTGWWGKPEGNVTDVIFRPIKSNATRVAALLSGEVDLIIDPPPQDLERLRMLPSIRIVAGAELRTMHITFNVSDAELKYGNVKGRNPFQDRRVRNAVALSIDRDALQRVVLRGLAVPTASLVPKGAVGYSARASGYGAPDLPRARSLLKEAGYPNGFKVTLDCSNDREQACAALAGMISKTGIEVALNVSPRAKFLQKISTTQRDFSIYHSGMAAYTGDAAMMLESLLHTWRADGQGSNNASGISSPLYDRLLAASSGELDPMKRQAIFEQLQLAEHEERFYVPLYQAITSWAMHRRVNVVHRPDNYLALTWVKVEKR